MDCRRSAMVVFLCMGLLRGAFCLAAKDEHGVAPQIQSSPVAASESWQSDIQKKIAASEYHISYSDGACPPGKNSAAQSATVPTKKHGSWHAPNRAHDLRINFTEQGPRVERRTSQGPGWTWGLELLQAPVVEKTTAKGNRIEFERKGGLVEWYVNDPKGLEQGFTIAKPQNLNEAEIAVNIAVKGNLVPGMMSDGKTIEFLSQDGIGVLHYGSLKAWDARGKTLEARMELLSSACSPNSAAPQPSPESRIRLLVDASGDITYPVTIDPLATSASWTAESNQVDADEGYCVSTAGDVNGDGYADVVVGAPGYDNGEADEGRAYVYYGSASGLSATPDWTAESNQASARFGFALSAAGDVNGDGYGDIIIGADGYDNGEINEGRAYVYHGSASGLSPTPNWTAEGNQADAQYGYFVSAAGDVNGDGYGDAVVGARHYDNGETDEGRAYVYHGSASGLSTTADWTAESDQAGAEFGFRVSTAGDVNGDGYGDIIVGAELYDNGQADEGRAYVFHGSAAGLSLAPDWTMESDQTGARMGFSVSTAGDVNGDGYADVLVGADQYDNGQADEGRAYVYNGSASGLSTTPSWTGESNQSGARFGISAATAGDVNGDGYADIVVGAIWYDNGQLDEGRAYMYYGSASGASPTANWMVESDQINAGLGVSVSTAGDVNGDGYADVIVGSWLYDSGQTDEGRAFVYNGSASGLGNSSGWAAETNQAGSYLGYSVSTAGDVNGDGYADVVVGAMGYDNGETDEGRAYVYNGSASGLSATPAWIAESDQAGAGFGVSVSAAGDVNGDGFGDVIVSAGGYDNGEVDEGRAYVYHGSASGLSATPDWAGEGNQASAQYGYTVSSAGDVNGDGYGDVVIGARLYDNGQTDEGRAYVYHGSATGLSTTADWTAESNQAGAEFGFRVSTAGDVNGDGYSDIIVGAELYDNGQTDEGRAFVYHGSASGLSATPNWTVESDQAGARMGFCVSTAGDVNGDGFAEVLVGADQYANGQVNEGRAYVYNGSASGLSTTAGWTWESNQAGARFGMHGSTAGDVNGDGYADIIVGSVWYDNGQTDEGRAFVFHGSASGLAAAPSWTAESNQASSDFSVSVATAGDVNGDGYADVIIGSWYYDNGQTDEGGAFVYYGNGEAGQGLSLRPQQLKEDNNTIAPMGISPGNLRLAAIGRSPFGRGKAKIEYEIKPLGTSFDGTGTVKSPSWASTNTTGTLFSELTNALPEGVKHWRARLLYDPVTTPYQQRSRWFTQPWSGWQEGDLRVDYPPTCIVTTPASPTSATLILFEINFNESVTGLTAGEITVTGGTTGPLTGGGAGPYVLPVTPTGDGLVTCQVPAGAAQDFVDNGNIVSNIASITYDGTPPACTVTSPASPTSATLIQFEINFAEPVMGLTAGEIAVTGGAKGSLAGSGAGPYLLSVTPSGDGLVTCQVPADAAQDAAGNGNTSSTIANAIYDRTAPVCTITGPTSPTSASLIVFTINFSEAVTGLTAGEITVMGGTKGTLTGSGTGPYMLPVTANSDGPVTCQVPADAAQDAAANGNTSSTIAGVTYDGTQPSCTATGPASPTSASLIVFTINFSEAVTGLTAGEIAVTGGTKGALAGSGTGPYTLSVTVTGDGTATCQVPAGVAQDAAGNGNTSSSLASVTYDGTAPACTIAAPASPTSASLITFEIVFSEPVTGLSSEEIILDGGTNLGLTSSDASHYTLQVRPTAVGTVSCQVPAGAASDAVEHGNGQSNTASLQYQGPTLPPLSASNWISYE